MSRAARFAAASALAIGAVGLSGSPGPAAAYGTAHQYEVTLSYNCQNKAICPSTPFGIGGIWGWLEPDAEGSGPADGELTFQGHNNADPSLNGVGKSISVDGFTTINCGSNPLCLFVALEAPPTDPNGNYFVFFVTFRTAGGSFQLPVVTPATPGHYSFQLAPGVNAQATVTEV
jgi:hypothetical protein